MSKDSCTTKQGRKKRGRRQGSSSLLTKELTQRVANLIRAGNYVDTAAACVGISKQTLYNWLRNGARASALKDSGRKLNTDEALSVEFSEAIEVAQAQAEASLVGIVAQAARGSSETPPVWQAAACLLERKFPAKWGRRSGDDAQRQERKPLPLYGDSNATE